MSEQTWSADQPWRREDGSIIWCPAPHPEKERLSCARIIGHDGPHENGTWRWEEDQ